MAQLSPSTTYYAQALALINEFKSSYTTGRYSSTEEVTEKLNDIVSRFNDRLGKPLTVYFPFAKGEPPIAAKFNQFLNYAQADINIMQEQLTLLRASAIFLHNYIATEILRAQRENAQAQNKLKTLQLYSTAQDENVLVLGDYFKNTDFMDTSLISVENQASLLASGHLTLGRETDTENLTENSEINILATSNGFLGNNQEVEDPTKAPINPATGQPDYTFKAELNRHADIEEVTDGEPNTWIEYEVYRVSTTDRNIAKGFNFVYKTNRRDDLTSSEASDSILRTDQPILDWSKGPRGSSGDVLHLDVEFDFGEVRTINTITYTPFGLEENANHPVKISIVQTSADGTDWLPVEPQNLWVGTDANLQAARSADNVVTGAAVWSFDQRSVRYVRIKIEQNRQITTNIGHLYYETRPTVVTTTEQTDDDDDQVATTETVVGGERREGPIPPLDDPGKYYGEDNFVRDGLVQKTEVFVGERWVIGIRDILIEEVKYKTSSVMVSKPFRINGVIDRVALEADLFIPPSFPTNDLWVKFFVSPDDGLNWFPISRIQDDFFGIPEIIAFNDPLPPDFHEVGVTYHSVGNTVDQLRMKIELTRPADFESSSPIVFNYKLKIRKR